MCVSCTRLYLTGISDFTLTSPHQMQKIKKIYIFELPPRSFHILRVPSGRAEVVSRASLYLRGCRRCHTRVWRSIEDHARQEVRVKCFERFLCQIRGYISTKLKQCAAPTVLCTSALEIPHRNCAVLPAGAFPADMQQRSQKKNCPTLMSCDAL